jgi:hypothetical protein
MAQGPMPDLPARGGAVVGDLIRWLLRTLVVVAAPVLLVLGGATLAGLGLDHDLAFLVWTGLIVAACGLLWGGWLLLVASAGGDTDLAFGDDSDGASDSPSWKIWTLAAGIAAVLACARLFLGS